jgi:hypothetical protein
LAIFRDIEVSPDLAERGGSLDVRVSVAWNRKTLDVTIPPNVRDGQTLRLRSAFKGEDVHLRIRLVSVRSKSAVVGFVQGLLAGLNDARGGTLSPPMTRVWNEPLKSPDVPASNQGGPSYGVSNGANPPKPYCGAHPGDHSPMTRHKWGSDWDGFREDVKGSHRREDELRGAGDHWGAEREAWDRSAAESKFAYEREQKRSRDYTDEQERLNCEADQQAELRRQEDERRIDEARRDEQRRREEQQREDQRRHDEEERSRREQLSNSNPW